MADLEKEALSSLNSEEKRSLLGDFDLGKDFLSSWKSMNVTEDITMDFDFGPLAKVNNKAFKDMDFSFNGNFDKIQSFGIDMPDLEISSPLEKVGKFKERSKRESGNNQDKADSFAFPFDSNELDSFSFESSLMKKDKRFDKNQDGEECTNRNEDQSSGKHLTKDTVLEDGMNVKLPESGIGPSSEIDTEVSGGQDLASITGNLPSKAVTNDNSLSKLSTSADEVELNGLSTSPEKTASMNSQEMGLEMVHQENRASLVPEAYPRENMQDVSVQSVSGNASIRKNALELQEEVISWTTKVIASSSSEKNVNAKQIASSGCNDEHNLLGNLASQHTASFPCKNKEGSKFGSNKHALIDNKDDAEPAQSDSQFESTFVTSASWKSMQHTNANTMNQDLTPKHVEAPLSSGNMVDGLMPCKERDTGAIQSKFFKRSDETISHLQHGSSSQIHTLLGRGTNGTMQLSDTDDRRKHADAQDAQHRNKLASISLLQLREMTRHEPVQLASQGSIKGLSGTRTGFNTDGTQIGKHLAGTSRTPDQDVTKGELASRENGKINENHVDAISSCVSSPISNEQKNKFSSRNYANPRLPVFGSISIQDLKTICVEQNKISHCTAVRTPDISSLKIPRTDGTKIDPKTSSIQKDIKALGNLEQGKKASSIAHSVDKEKQKPPTPPLKRKIFESLSGNMLISSSSKRLSLSPRENRNLRETPEEVPDKKIENHEDLRDGYTKGVSSDCHISSLDITCEMAMTVKKDPTAVEKDSNIEKAEACTKELEDICNMLKKKHEEAKETLVRAIVNNNNLLMLNHPVFEQKIRRVEKFASRLISK